MYLKSFLLSFLSLFCFYCHSYSDILRYEDYIYSDNIETVLFQKSGSVYSYPVIDLSMPDDALLLSFDDLDGDYKSLQYTIIHCEQDWTKSNIFSNEYLEGSTFENVIDYKPSFNTVQKYTQYWLYVPSKYLRPKISGNYLLVVYMTGDESNILITRRFYVVDNKVNVHASIHQPSYAKYRNSKQEIDFEVNYSGLNVMNPMTDIKVTIRQNQRWDNMLVFSRPQYMHDNLLIYDFEEENLFDGYGEFRFVDLRAFRYPGFGVNKIKLDSFYHLYLFLDDDRSYKTYGDWQDANGSRIISGDDQTVPSYELDYIFAHFKLDSPFSPDEGNVYLFGALTDWRIQKKFKMTYNSNDKLYEGIIKLKQGYYNYQYVTVNKDGTIDPASFEGSHYETENDYLLCVYYKTPILNSDLLVGVSYLNSVKNK